MEKPFYRPIEAAIRWCGLIDQEAMILAVMVDKSVPAPADFPDWPCLRVNAEKILDAMLNGALPTGRNGKPVSHGDHVAEPRKTVRHSDLKAWMALHYPDQKPEFLFDEIERNTHSAITPETYYALKVAHDEKEHKLSQANERIRESEEAKGLAEKEREELLKKMNNLTTKIEATGVLSKREETTYLNIIAVLLEYIEGNFPGIQKHPSFVNEAQLIEKIADLYKGYSGLSQSTLSRKFPEAKRSIQAG